MSVDHWRATMAWRGTAYVGWQRQPNGLSIQAVMERCLGKVCGRDPIQVTAAGRTDSGVHALAQCVVFKTQDRSADELLKGLNFWLPDDIAVLDVAPAAPGFNPRQDAKQKLYRYRILQRIAPCPFRGDLTWHRRHWLDVDAMAEGAAYLVGEHDFTTFRASGCSAKIPVRNIHSLTVQRESDEIVVEVKGGGFLRHQVRIIVGTLAQVGAGRCLPSSIEGMLFARDRAAAGPTAPGHGLCLVWVTMKG
jgi:tRNA pseudouridine38-40 synthase